MYRIQSPIYLLHVSKMYAHRCIRSTCCNYHVYTCVGLYRYGVAILRTYTLNHEKRDILFLTITLANLRRFFYNFCIILIVKTFYMQLQ